MLENPAMWLKKKILCQRKISLPVIKNLSSPTLAQLVIRFRDAITFSLVASLVWMAFFLLMNEKTAFYVLPNAKYFFTAL